MRLRQGLPLLLLLGGCSSPVGEEGGATTPPEVTEPAGDVEGPSIDLMPIDDGRPIGEDVVVRATITDPSGVASAVLYYRASGTDFWTSAFLVSSGELWSATIPGDFVQDAGVDYYVKATDASFARNSSTAPAAAPASPAHFDAIGATLPFRFQATFDPEGDPAIWRLSDTGWIEYVRGFDNLENWTLTTERSRSGAYSAYHGHGSPYQSTPFEDWLVSPPVDLSQASSADLYWWEVSSPPEYADHAVYVSAGDADPSAGEYVAVADPVPASGGGGWGRSVHVDLSAFAGEPQVYIAFVYRGTWLDDWTLDNVTLELPSPDLVVGALASQPEVLDPGATAQVVFEVTNEGLEEATGVIARVGSSDALVQVPEEGLALPPVAPGAPMWVGPFEVKLDPSHADDVYVPLTLELISGQRSWKGEGRLQVGRPPVARVTITHTFENDIQLAIGWGNPAGPAWYTVVAQDQGEDDPGTFEFEVDVSGQMVALPPDTGAHRWFIQAWDDSVGNTGTVDSFSITWGEQTWEADALPRPIPDDGSSVYVYLPGRSDFSVGAVDTDPDVASPGAEVGLTVLLYNHSTAPAGPLSGALSSSDPDVVLVDNGPWPFTYQATTDQLGVGIYGQAYNEIPFRFAIGAGHLDSTPVKLNLTVTDGVSSWQVPVEVAVPWVVLGGLSLSIEDVGEDGAAGDEILSPGESASLRVRVRNGGDLPTAGPLTAKVTVVADNGAGVALGMTEVTLAADVPFIDTNTGGVSPGGGGKSPPIPITVAGGAAGDPIVLEVDVTDGVNRYVERQTLTLGQLPTLPITLSDDPRGDSCASVDLRSGSFTHQGTMLTLRWQTWEPFDPGNHVLWTYLSASQEWLYGFVFTGGSVYYYRWVTSSSGSAYWAYYYTPPDSLSVRQIDDDTVETRLDLTDFYLQAGALWAGASVGPVGEVPCDYAPDDAASGRGTTRIWW